MHLEETVNLGSRFSADLGFAIGSDILADFDRSQPLLRFQANMRPALGNVFSASLIFVVSALTVPHLLAAEGGAISFQEDVLPVLKRRCWQCHGPDADDGSFRIDRLEGHLASGTAGQWVARGNPIASRLYQVLGGDDQLQMPPSGPIPRRERELIERWIDQGADVSRVDESSSVADRHWSFQKISRPAIPIPSDQDWTRNAIDSFVLAKLDREQLDPSPEADKHVQMRRLSIDLTGLPPDRSLLNRFLADPSDSTYDRVVDELLSSPEFGQRWGQHWLDVARYGDTDGYFVDQSRPGMWVWRDWVIDSINSDQPFDAFTVHQIAGDLIGNPSTRSRVATGFLRNSIHNRENGVDPEEFRFARLTERVDAIGTVWLGLTLGCARCHDHKYDPIKQTDYFALVALIDRGEEVEMYLDPEVRRAIGELERVEASLVRRRCELLEIVRERKLNTDQAIGVRTPSSVSENAGRPAVTSLVLLIVALPPLGILVSRSKRYRVLGVVSVFAVAVCLAQVSLNLYLDRVVPNALADGESIRVQQYSEERELQHLAAKDPQTVRLERNRSKLKAVTRTASPALVMNPARSDRPTYLRVRGEYHRLGEVVAPGVPQFLDAGSQPIVDRLALADWLVSPDNPLVARTIVNRIWLRLFGAGLVRSSDDLGSQGEPPTHPELLDWLANEFVQRGWSRKRLIRMIVTSSAYRQSSTARAELAASDPVNRLLAVQNRFPLDAESVRDHALAVSGQLDVTPGGPSFRPPYPAGYSLDDSETTYVPDAVEDCHRRSVYSYWKRGSLHPYLMAFGAPDRSKSCPQRRPFISSQQALLTLNSDMFFQAGRSFGRRLAERSRLGVSSAICWGWQESLAREPSAAEIDAARALYIDLRTAYEADSESATRCVAGLRPAGASDAELAAWIGIGRTLLNLDEFLSRE